ncbi:MAG: hypothetical protein U9O85_01490 [Euryarchaeota archaeon]|nr:hypothetical protein [Euryarchaeota archaeon]
MLKMPLLINGGIITTDNYSFPANLSIQVVNNELWYNSPLFSTLLGVIIGAMLVFLTNILYSRLQERNELKRYEYTLLSRTKDLLNRPLDDKTEKEIKDFVDKLYPDLRFSKLKSSKLITDALLKAMRGKSNSEESSEIDNQIKKIRKSVKRRIL